MLFSFHLEREDTVKEHCVIEVSIIWCILVSIVIVTNI